MFKALSARSIASRLFLSAAFWSILILALAGLGLSALNKQWTEANFDDQLGVYLKALVANVAVPTEEGKTAAPAAIAPQFELAFSGWYWQSTRTDVNPPEIRASKSLFATQLPQLVAVGNDHGAILSGYAVGPGGHQLRMIQREIDAGDDGRFLVQVAANADVIQAQERSFEYGLAATFSALGLALIGSPGLGGSIGRPATSDIRQSTDPRQPRDRRARADPGWHSRPCAQNAAQRLDERSGFDEPRVAGQGARADRDHAPAGDVLSRPRARRRPRQDLWRRDGSKAGGRGACPHLREAAWRPSPDFRRHLAAGSEIPGRGAGSDRSDRQPARQRRKVGARTGLHSCRPRRRTGFRSISRRGD